MSLIRDSGANVRLRAKALDLLSYGADFIVREAAWDFGGELAGGDYAEGDEQEVPVLEHEDVIITMPNKGSTKLKKSSSISYQGKWKCFFDGGCRKGTATGGFVIFDTTGKLVKGKALFFGKGSNNMAEASAVEELLTALHEMLP